MSKETGCIIEINLFGLNFIFKTRAGLFSPKAVDAGTLAMLEAAFPCFTKGARVLDLGCGYGVVGILAAKLCGHNSVFMSDISPEAVMSAKENALLNGVPQVAAVESSGFANISEAGFNLILSNPPYHSDFKIAKEFIEKGFNRLKIGGKMFMVTKRLDWYKNKFNAIFGGVKITEKDSYFVFMAEKRKPVWANKDAKKNGS